MKSFASTVVKRSLSREAGSVKPVMKVAVSFSPKAVQTSFGVKEFGWASRSIWPTALHLKLN